MYRTQRTGEKGRARVRLATTAFICALIFIASRSFAAEDWAAFLDALKTRGYDDVALVYLKQLQSDGSAPPELNDELDYRIGAAAFDEAAKATGARRDALWDEAEDAFAKYLEKSPSGEFALEANSGTADIETRRADALFAEANRKGTSEETRTQKLEQARVYMTNASKSLAAASKLSTERLKASRGQDSNAANFAADSRRAQATHIDLMTRYANARAQIARTYPEGSSERKEELEQAAARFAKIFSAYQQYPLAFKARLYEAQIDRELGKDDAALSLLSEIDVLPYEQEFFALKTLSLALYSQIVEERGGTVEQMTLVQKYRAWRAASLLESFYESAEGRAIQRRAGAALLTLEKTRRTNYREYADAGKQVFVDATDPVYKELNVGEKKSVNKLLLASAKILGAVGNGRDEEAAAAKSLLQDELFQGLDVEKLSTNVVDGFDAAVNEAYRAASIFAQKKTARDSASPEFAQEAQKDFDAAAIAALDAFRVALDMSAKEMIPDKRGSLNAENATAARDEVNKILLKYSVIAYYLERYEEAFVAGDRVAREKESPEAEQGGVLALKALQAIQGEARAQNSAGADSLDAKVDEYAAFCRDAWGENEDSLVAQEAIVAQLENAVASGDIDGAVAALEKIPESSPRRASAELSLGRALWSLASKKNAAATDSDQTEDAQDSAQDAAREDAPEKLFAAAQKYLYDGLERKITTDSGTLDDDGSAIYSAYLLAQSYVQQGAYADAEKWLTHPRIGALALIARAEEGNAPSFIDDSFKIAALSSALLVQGSDPARLEEAKGTMAKLEAIAANSPDSGKKLTNVYLSLGRRFEERLTLLKNQAAAGDESKRAELLDAAKGLATFLDNVASRADESNYAALRWSGDAYLTIGRELRGKTAETSTEAAPYFVKARDVYKTLVQKIDADPTFAPSPDSRVAVLLKVCEILRYEEKYSTAYKNLTAILEKRPDYVDAQWEAATLLEAWGRVDSKYYTLAMTGDGKTLWGWNGLMKRLGAAAAKDDRAKELYFDACKAKARTRYRYVSALKDPKEKETQAKNAEMELERLAQLHAGFNGPESVKYFNDAYRALQRLRGVASPKDLTKKK